MTKRKYISEDEAEDDGYSDAECPECGAIVTVRFQRGRRWRRLQCPSCLNQVTIPLEEEPSDQTLIQIRKTL